MPSLRKARALPRKPFKAADLFCGAGGDSAGIEDACHELELELELTAVIHWDIAVQTHTKNFPSARHLCASIDSLNPRALYKEGELKFMWASPECTHHSVARGGKPIKDQSRATAWCVARWAEALHPDQIIVENVKEFRNWGPCIRKKVKYVWRPDFKKWHKKTCSKLPVKLARARWKRLKGEIRTRLDWVPDPKRKGEIFLAWIAAIESAGYRVDHRVFCAADYGDPTTRERLFIQCVRTATRKKIVWPNPTHQSPEGLADSGQARDLFESNRRPWVPARDIIDWNLKGKSIFDRALPHADNTLHRIFIGFLQGLSAADLTAFTLGQQSGSAARPVSEPVPTVATQGAIGLAQPKLKPHIVKLKGTGTVAEVSAPAPTVTAGGNVLGIMEPCLVEVNHGKDGTKSDAHRIRPISKPLGTVTGSRGTGLCEFVLQTDQTGGNGICVRKTNRPVGTVVTKANLAVVEATLKPYITRYHGDHKGKGDARNRNHPVEEPLPTVDGSNRYGVVEPKLDPFVVPQFSSQGPRSVDKPLGTVTTQSRGVGLATPMIVPTNYGERSGQTPRVHSPDKPMPTVVGSKTHGLAEPYLVNMKGQSNASSVDKPTPTVTAHAPHLYVAEPQFTPEKLEIPFILPHEGVHRGNAARPVTEPMPTVTASHGGGRLCVAQVIKFYGTGGAKSVKLPLDTVTTKERFALVEFLITEVKRKNRPIIEINGQTYSLEILFRMFQWYELALAQGFRPGYQFTGNNEEVVKQIGNAVPRRLVRALVRAALTQDPNVPPLPHNHENAPSNH